MPGRIDAKKTPGLSARTGAMTWSQIGCATGACERPPCIGRRCVAIEYGDVVESERQYQSFRCRVLRRTSASNPPGERDSNVLVEVAAVKIDDDVRAGNHLTREQRLSALASGPRGDTRISADHVSRVGRIHLRRHHDESWHVEDRHDDHGAGEPRRIASSFVSGLGWQRRSGGV
jgi:hypothetical protein